MKGKIRTFARIALWTVVIATGTVLLLFTGLYAYAQGNVDYSRDEMLFDSKQYSGATKLYYYDGEGEAREYALLSPSDCKQIWYSYSDIPSSLKCAFISAEDRGFFSHGGVSIKRTLYAAVNYIFKLGSEFGGSTITQQVVKNISGDNEHSAVRKINEILRAIHIEDVYSKEEIFEVYLNIVPMGDGISGVGFAAQHYFGKEPCELTVDEAAVLVGITNAPSRYDPYKCYEACLEKRNRVLYAMLDNGVLTEDEYESLINKEIPLAERNNYGYAVDSWFTETVFHDVSRDLARELNISEVAARALILNGGYSIYTTVVPEIQGFLEEYFSDPANFPDAVNEGLDFSMVITDSRSGSVVGVVGSVGKKGANRIINGVDTAHTPGSALKPLALYAPILEQGAASWSTVYDDSPVSFYQNSDGEYVDYPKNSPMRYDGLITLADALRLSKNTVAARIYNELGAEHIFGTLTDKYGFSLCDRQKTERGVLTDKAMSPLALGQLTYGVTLRELTGAYSAFVSEGIYRKPVTYGKVVDAVGNTVLKSETATKRVLGTDTARIMNQLLSRVVDSGTAKSITLNELYDTAGKTGTSGGDKDRLFIGYTPYYTAGIWCGYKNGNKAIGAIEKGHLAIWDEVMHEVHEIAVDNSEDIRTFSVLGLQRLPYCMDSGELLSNNCLHDPRGSRLDYGYFSGARRPSRTCDRHVLCLINSEGGLIGDQELVSLIRIPERDYPTEIEVADEKYAYFAEDGGYMAIEPFFMREQRTSGQSVDKRKSNRK